MYKTCYCDQLVTDAIKKKYVFVRFNKLQMFRIFLENQEKPKQEYLLRKSKNCLSIENVRHLFDVNFKQLFPTYADFLSLLTMQSISLTTQCSWKQGLFWVKVKIMKRDDIFLNYSHWTHYESVMLALRPIKERLASSDVFIRRSEPLKTRVSEQMRTLEK